MLGVWNSSNLPYTNYGQEIDIFKKNIYIMARKLTRQMCVYEVVVLEMFITMWILELIFQRKSKELWRVLQCGS